MAVYHKSFRHYLLNNFVFPACNFFHPNVTALNDIRTVKQSDAKHVTVKKEIFIGAMAGKQVLMDKIKNCLISALFASIELTVKDNRRVWRSL